MKQLRGFLFERNFFLISVMIFFLTNGLTGENHRVHICEAQFSWDNLVLEEKQESTWVYFKSQLDLEGRRIPVNFIAACVPNSARTTHVLEIGKGTGGAAEKVLEYSRLPDGTDVVFYKKDRVEEGRLVHSVQAYFATRDFEYRMHFFQSLSAGNSDFDRSALLVLKSITSRIELDANARRTISEGEYVWRLVVLAGSAGLVILGCAAFFLIRKKRKPEVPFTSSDPELPPVEDEQA